MKFLHLIWRNLARKKLRTILTVLSIGVAFVLFGVLSAFKLAMGAGVSLAAENRMIVRNRVSFIQPLPFAYQGRIARIPGVSAVSFQSWFGGYYQHERNQIGSFAVDPEGFFEVNPEVVLADEAKAKWEQTRTGAIIGRKLAERFGWNVGDRVPLKTMWPTKTGEGWSFDIVGIYDGAKKTSDTSAFYFQWDYFDEARAWANGTVGWFQVVVDDPARITAIAAQIDEEFANSPAETKSESEAAMFQGFARQVGDIATIVTAILSAVFFTILLVAGNTMAQSVRERTQEIGVLKALGFSGSRVLGIVLSESIAIAILGGAGGLFAGWALVTMIGQAPQVQTYFPIFFVSARDLALGGALAFGLGIIAGIFPAVQAMRLRLADALRREG